MKGSNKNETLAMKESFVFEFPITVSDRLYLVHGLLTTIADEPSNQLHYFSISMRSFSLF